jgi:sterol desaturase/sphingolipid hydroxylase (fatty acid hydroxylase superfamily)
VLLFGLEALWPRRRDQKQLRPTLGWDLMMLVWNGHFLGVAIYVIARRWDLPHWDVAARWPSWLQIVTVLLVIDFVEWCVHNLLHRVPFLWTFHQVHHSVRDGEMDFIVSFRFHWMEVVVYKSIKYLPLAFFGFSSVAVMVHAVVGTLIGHLNHSNLDWGHGPFRYLLNTPRMHLWHHDYDTPAGGARNFGIIFSCWDWLFGTAYMPDGAPRKLGFPGVEEFPRSFFAQLGWPLRGMPAVIAGAAIVSGALSLFFY